MRRIRHIVAIATACVLCAACGRLGYSTAEVSSADVRDARAVGTAGRGGDHQDSVAAIVGAREAPAFVGHDKDSARLWALTRQFYQKRDDRFAWIDGRHPRPQMDDLIRVLQHVDRDGLDPALYDAATLAERRKEAGRGFLTAKGFDPEKAATLDVWLTYLYLEYASDIVSGVGGLAHADPNWQIKPARVDPVALLDAAIERNRIAQSLEDLLPRDPQYVSLRDMLAKYRETAKRGGWPPVPARLKLKPGQQSAAVPAIAKRLAVTRDYTGGIDQRATMYGPELQEAVRRFQRRHGLEPDGAIGPAVVEEMNVPVAARIAQIALNLERLRWLPRDLGDRHILVNIPEYRLEVWDHGEVPLAMKVVVGKKDTPTPIFDDQMTHVVFAPYWNVPTDIVQKETLPHVMRDPTFLAKTNMEVLDKTGRVIDPSSVDLSNPDAYRFRQRPGASNSLGSVKFMFPNQFNVYLHDTPADSLFARATRSFSHGCVRIERPEDLAVYVLGDQPEWTRERIEAAMHGGEEKAVKLREPLPVFLGYWTARVSPDGLAQFRRDIYGIDRRQTALLAAMLEKIKARTAAASRLMT
jgi:murein L,D-transpeptidase YcbB/YkuD